MALSGLSAGTTPTNMRWSFLGISVGRNPSPPSLQSPLIVELRRGTLPRGTLSPRAPQELPKAWGASGEPSGSPRGKVPLERVPLGTSRIENPFKTLF